MSKKSNIVFNFLNDKDKIKNNLSSYSRKRPNNKKNEKDHFRKAKSEECLFYPITEEDSEAIILLKNTINESKLSMQDIYDKLGSSKGYNLHYGLLKRNEIKLSSLQAWADILHKKISIQFIDYDE